MTYSFGKRIMDILGALVGLTLFSPLLAVVALYIKAVSPSGPVFADMKPRVGKDYKLFKMYKFRTMFPNAQEWLKTQPELYKKYIENGYKLDPDPRLIKGATFIRKSSIDEMPQFINVLLGNMSIVGPRAYFDHELREQEARYPQTADHIKQTLTVKPGITGPWQIGGRSQIGFVERIKMDADYAKSRSLLYDLAIILKTPYVVLRGEGAC